jgi:proteasome lid subunit RPN8/RPN11
VDVIGYYHSHPDHPAIPSEFDREHALPFYAYISAGGGADQLAADAGPPALLQEDVHIVL